MWFPVLQPPLRPLPRCPGPCEQVLHFAFNVCGASCIYDNMHEAPHAVAMCSGIWSRAASAGTVHAGNTCNRVLPLIFAFRLCNVAEPGHR